MAMNRTLFGGLALTLTLALIGCGGSITGGGLDAAAGTGGPAGTGGSAGPGGTTGTGGSGPDASTTIPCTALGACECLAASGRCAPRAEACWCPTECYPSAPIECVCGGGRFLACEDQALLAACTTALAAVQTKCANQPFIQYVSSLCATAGNPTCVAGCLANLAATGSCSEIDCGFCTVCDCAGPSTPSPFASCLLACAPPLPN